MRGQNIFHHSAQLTDIVYGNAKYARLSADARNKVMDIVYVAVGPTLTGLPCIRHTIGERPCDCDQYISFIPSLYLIGRFISGTF